MAQVELIMPKMGESIMEATILKWLKQEGDRVELDEAVLEIATDKVDSEVPSPIEGVIAKILHQEDEVIEVGKPIAIIATEGEDASTSPSPATQESPATVPSNGNGQQTKTAPQPEPQSAGIAIDTIPATASSDRFYSPLVRNIAKKEQIGYEELQSVPGSGMDGRVTKKDILSYVENRGNAPVKQPEPISKSAQAEAPKTASSSSPSVSASGNIEIVEMDRMRRMISDHMVRSKHTSPHVTSFVEVDVTGIVNWRNRVKASFQKSHGEKITFTPIFIEAVAKAIRDFPMVNISVDGNNIIVKKDINVGMAAALPSGNLIVPVIKNADHLSLFGLTKKVNDLASRARKNKLKPEEIQGGTFTLTNVGTFGNVMGTPIINQPQVAIMAVGAIRKKPAVVETEYGDLIAVRHMMFLSLSYDHRVVDGMLGGSFLSKVGYYLENFDAEQTI